MANRAYIYAEDGALLGHVAMAEELPDILEVNGRYFQQHGTMRDIEDDSVMFAFDYWEIDPGIHTQVIHICVICGRNASLVWWKCCPAHATLDGPDVLCQTCTEQFHPGEEEFERP